MRSKMSEKAVTIFAVAAALLIVIMAIDIIRGWF